MKDMEQRRKNKFFAFFELIYRKFPKLVGLNLVYFICILPLICAAFYLVLGLFEISPDIIDNTYAAKVLLKLGGISWLPNIVKTVIVLVSAVAFGPLTCGFTYVVRNHATEQHAWFTDFFSRAKENWKQGILLGFIDIVLCFCLILYLAMDLSAVATQTSYYYAILCMKYIAIVAFVLYFVMRFYTYAIAVSVELKLRDIFRNARLFLVLGAGRNLLTLVITVIVVFSFLSTSFIDIVLMSTFLFSCCTFVAMYLTFPVVKKYMYPAEEVIEETEEDAD